MLADVQMTDTKSVYQGGYLERRLTWVRLMLHTQLWLKESKLQDWVMSRTDGYVINVINNTQVIFNGKTGYKCCHPCE